MLDEYDITFENRCRVFVDDANPSFIRALKDRIGEDSDYERHISVLKTNFGADKFSTESLIYYFSASLPFVGSSVFLRTDEPFIAVYEVVADVLQPELVSAIDSANVTISETTENGK